MYQEAFQARGLPPSVRPAWDAALATNHGASIFCVTTPPVRFLESFPVGDLLSYRGRLSPPYLGCAAQCVLHPVCFLPLVVYNATLGSTVPPLVSSSQILGLKTRIVGKEYAGFLMKSVAEITGQQEHLFLELTLKHFHVWYVEHLPAF